LGVCCAHGNIFCNECGRIYTMAQINQLF
jgi:hypothetical protein